MASAAPFDVLLVCTGNQCRSPMAEAFLRNRLGRRGISARVHSAGLVSEGTPASAHAVRAMAKRGIDISAHVSRPLTLDDITAADLIIGMAREHVREVVVLDPGTLHRSFTLRELVRRGEDEGCRRHALGGVAPDDRGLEPVTTWIERLAADRPAASLLGRDPSDDVADPIGMSRRTYERTATELEQLIDRFVAVAFPVVSTRSYST